MCTGGHRIFVRYNVYSTNGYFDIEIQRMYHKDIPADKTHFDIYDINTRQWIRYDIRELYNADTYKSDIDKMVQDDKRSAVMRRGQTQQEVVTWLLCSRTIPNMNNDIRRLIGSYIMRPPYDFPKTVAKKLHVRNNWKKLYQDAVFCLMSVIMMIIITFATDRSGGYWYVMILLWVGQIFSLILSLEYIKPLFL